MAVQPFHLQRTKQRLRACVVPTVVCTAHRWRNAVLAEYLTEVVACVLAAAIAMKDQLCLLTWIALEPGHLQSIDHKVTLHIQASNVPALPWSYLASPRIRTALLRSPFRRGKITQIEPWDIHYKPLAVSSTQFVTYGGAFPSFLYTNFLFARVPHHKRRPCISPRRQANIVPSPRRRPPAPPQVAGGRWQVVQIITIHRFTMKCVGK